MIGSMPEFIKSPFFEPEPEWHLKEGAPEEVVKEFNEYMKAYTEWANGLFKD